HEQATSDSVTIESDVLPRVGDDVDILVTRSDDDDDQVRITGTVVCVHWTIQCFNPSRLTEMKSSDPDNDRFCIAGARYEKRRADEADSFCFFILSAAGIILAATVVVFVATRI